MSHIFSQLNYTICPIAMQAPFCYNGTMFLPMFKDEVERRGWHELDIILVSGDAYVDHPSFAAALIGRLLESKGFRVGIIAQPNWRDTKDITRLGRPRLFFGVTGGNLDSMLAHYTAAKKLRRDDAYSPGGKAGLRPNRATIVYSNLIRRAFQDISIVLGGVEASLRRLAHYDYWDDKVRRSILLDAKADILVYGMGERQIVEIAQRLSSGEKIKDLCDISGTTIVRSESAEPPRNDKIIHIPSFEEVSTDKRKFAEAFRLFYLEQDAFHGKAITQKSGNRFVIQLPPAKPLTQNELDEIYDLPYERNWHPHYDKFCIPAFETVKFSITSHRGCFGTCSFCSIFQHQGRIVQSRSETSILKEAKKISEMPYFKGHITDVGGPTANMYGMFCERQSKLGSCKDKDCLMPSICNNLKASHIAQLKLLEKIRSLPKVKKVSLGTGVRYDLALNDHSCKYLEELCKHYISGQLKIAPEHISNAVLKLMNKPRFEVYEEFIEEYKKINKRLGKEQYFVPYFVSSHPGCSVKDMVALAAYIKKRLGFRPEQVQDFIPNPMTLSTAMYYTEINPLTGESVYVAKTQKEKSLQRKMLSASTPAPYLSRRKQGLS